MNTAQPIRSPEELKNLKKYYREVRPDCRNQLMIIIGLNTALRISDVLSLQWKHVCDFDRKCYKKHIVITEQKTGKESVILINQNVQEAIGEYYQFLQSKRKRIEKNRYLFRVDSKNIPLSRVQAFRIVKEAANYYGIQGSISCHSLRKTFGYHAWKQGTSPALLMNIFNHSSYRTTKRYLGIEQDDRDAVFEQIIL